MVVKPFELERLRRNWDRAAEPASPPLPERFERVRPAIDPYPEARRVLARIDAMTKSEFSERGRGLGPFLAEAQDLLARIQAASSPRDAANPGAPIEDAAALRDQFQKVLNDLEDLFEVYAGIGLR